MPLPEPATEGLREGGELGFHSPHPSQQNYWGLTIPNLSTGTKVSFLKVAPSSPTVCTQTQFWELGATPNDYVLMCLVFELLFVYVTLRKMAEIVAIERLMLNRSDVTQVVTHELFLDAITVWRRVHSRGVTQYLCLLTDCNSE